MTRCLGKENMVVNKSRELDKQIGFWRFHFLDLSSKLFFFNILDPEGSQLSGLLQSVDEEPAGKFRSGSRLKSQERGEGLGNGTTTRGSGGHSAGGLKLHQVSHRAVFDVTLKPHASTAYLNSSSAPNPEHQRPYCCHPVSMEPWGVTRYITVKETRPQDSST